MPGTSRITVVAAAISNGGSSGTENDIQTACTLDGQNISGSEIHPQQGLPGYPITNTQICRGDPKTFNGTMTAGEHTLSVSVTTQNSSRLYLDYIVYETLPNAPVNGEILKIGSKAWDPTEDPNLVFSSGWGRNQATAAMSTSTPDANVTVKFNGTNLQLYGEVKYSDLDGAESNTATYQVDGQPPQSFQLLSGHHPSNQLLFNISSLEAGEHSILVKFTGQADKMPLSIDWFQATSLTAAEQAKLASPSSSATSFTPSSPSSPPSHSKVVGAIIGGTMGGSVFVALIAVLLWMWMRKRHRHLSTTNTINPFQLEKLSESTNSSAIEKESPISPSQSEMLSEPSDSFNLINDEINQIRVQNMKLQQRLALSQNHPIQAAQQSSAAGPMVHTDSGWRMGTSGEVPPVYTAT
ncbi:hypothetical protein L218DRAFT_1006890 [Marasmius fiardii PR-910]|nr:hypothetical protein L218DRAFT_1006890 [Marasmius fiardii PR-910]